MPSARFVKVVDSIFRAGEAIDEFETQYNAWRHGIKFVLIGKLQQAIEQ
jgi:hypothetical protein